MDLAGFAAAVEGDGDGVGGQIGFQATEAGLEAGGVDREV
jgi:hypothetical protein